MRKTPALALSALLLPVALAGCGASRPAAAGPLSAAQVSATSTGPPPGITARGTGRVTGAPDVMTIDIGVQTRAAHATDALAANAARAGAVISALKGHGVADADVQTSQLSLYPEYTGGGGAIIGYDVDNSVTAKLRDVSKAGATIDAAVAAAGDAGRLQGATFSIDDQSSLLARARKDAVTRARAQAQQLADAAGARLGALRTLAEGVTPALPVYRGNAAAGASQTAPTPVQPGTQELTVQVTGVWDLAS